MKGICKLCLKERNLIKRSHIWPNFMTKGMQDEKGRLNIINSDSPLRRKMAQSGAYQKFIFCEECDNVILGRLERYVSNNLYKKQYLINNADFEQENFINEEFQIIRCKSLEYNQVKLFLFSLLWRASISSEPVFKNFKLSYEEEDFLRQCIHDSAIVDESIFPCVLVTSSPTRLDKNFIAVDAFEPSIVKFYINDFIYMFYMTKNKIDQVTMTLSIGMDNNMGIMKVSIKKWDEIRHSILKAAVASSIKV